jgi:hypothetical protein
VRTNSVFAATAVASALLLGACGTVRAPSTVGSGSAPLLRIGTGGSAALAAARFVSTSGAGTYQVDGTLPSGPSRASTYLLRPADRSTVEHLATTLGLAARAVRHRHGWVVTSVAGQLRMADTGQWAFAIASDTCPSFMVDVDSAYGSMGVACAASSIVPPSAGGPASPPRLPPAPSAATLRAVADPLLSALGLDPGTAVVTPATATVWVDPVVAGLPTSGYGTEVHLDGHRIQAADGWTYPGRPTPGHEYPLISAAAALTQLASGPRPMMGAPAIACPMRAPSASAPTSICGGPSVVTGGRLGLSLRWDGGSSGSPVLVPAWFLTLRGENSPLVLIAVDPKYLAEPKPPTTGTNPATSPSAAPGSTGAGGATGSGGAVTAPDGAPTGGSQVPLP